MNVNEKELKSLRALLAKYKQTHGTFAFEQAESLNCTCGTTCMGGCYTYCSAKVK